MKLRKDPDQYYEPSEQFESYEYSIGDADMAIKVARDKLYSYPIRTLTQEYIANAYDACREARKCPSSIEIGHPTAASPMLTIRDFGPGLSPQRVSEVFVKYFSSTKRNSKKQQGFFGIGAKSAWAYKGCDSFTVVSYHGGRKTVYVSHTGISNRGTLTKISDEPSDEPSGVRIEIAVKADDFKSFSDAIKRAVFLWPIHPQTPVALPSPIYTGDGYRIYRSSDVPFISASVMAAADGITPYELPGLGFVDGRLLVVDLPADKMGIAPSRESFSEQALISKKIERIKESSSDVVTKLCLNGDYDIVFKAGLNRWSPSIRGLFGSDILVTAREFVTIAIKKDRKSCQCFDIMVGIPVFVTCQIVLEPEVSISLGDNKAARKLWLAAKRGLSLGNDTYSLLIVCKNAEYDGELPDIERLKLAYAGKIALPRKTNISRKRKAGTPVRIVTRGVTQPWIKGDAAVLEDFDTIEAVIMDTDNHHTMKLMQQLGKRVLFLPSDDAVKAAMALGYKTSCDVAREWLQQLSPMQLYEAALSGSNYGNVKVLSLCNKCMIDGWPTDIVLDEMKTIVWINDTKNRQETGGIDIMELLSHYKMPRPVTITSIVTSVFPLLSYTNYYSNKNDVDKMLYIIAKYRYLMEAPSEDYNALLLVFNELSRLKYEQPDSYPYQRGQQVQKSDQNIEEGLV